MSVSLFLFLSVSQSLSLSLSLNLTSHGVHKTSNPKVMITGGVHQLHHGDKRWINPRMSRRITDISLSANRHGVCLDDSLSLLLADISKFLGIRVQLST